MRKRRTKDPIVPNDAPVSARPTPTIAKPNAEQRAVVFRAEDGREVTFGLLYDALEQLGAWSWDGYERNYITRRLAESLSVEVIAR